ncbi:MAG: hypothetical protein JWM99_579 [Verrucomicrobiales bacterium]|nr:hypothetical protein [Verrucomicrobiales bacterium]
MGLLLAIASTPEISFAQNAYVQRNLVSDIPGLASITDMNLVNPWGIAASATSPFWVSDNHSGLSTLYNSTGGVQKVVVTIPAAAGGTGPGSPTGIIFNSTTNFVVTSGTSNAPARFIFATEDGTISGWASGTNAVLKADNSSAKAIYKGLANGSVGSSNYLYAANFYAGTIDVFDGNYAPATLAGSFSDPSIPAGFAPFNVQNFGGNLYVTYAKQDEDKHDDIGGPGNGFVNLFDTSGNLKKRLISNGVLNSPWGLTIAPSGFGLFAGDLLVGNFGDGLINAFDPISGTFLGTLKDSSGTPIANPGLWGLKIGNGGSGGETNTLYITAGIAGGDSLEDHGLFASLGVEPLTSPANVQHNLVSDVAGLTSIIDTNLVNPWGIATSGTSPFWISDNHSGVSTLYNSTGAVQSLIVTIPAAAGGTGPGSPTGIIFNSTTNFVVPSNSSNAPAKFIFATEDGTISGWASGTNAVLKADNSTSGAVYKGLANGSVGSSNYLYAANFYAGTIDVFDGNYAAAHLAGNFSDPSIPAGFAPFNIQNFGGNLYVTYAKQDEDKHDDVGGPGNGLVDVFDTSGNLQRRLISNGALNSPWGLAMAPASYGLWGGDLLVGNFGDGHINAFDPQTGLFISSLKDPSGTPISIQGLWGLKFGNGGNGGNTNTLYFTAGIAGSGSVEDHGLFGSIAIASPLQFTSFSIQGVALNLGWSAGVPPYLLQRKTSLADDTWTDVLTTTNQTAIVPTDSADAFYRLQDHSTVTVTPFTVLMSGPGEAPKPTTSTATGYGLFSLEGSTLNYSITYKGLSGPPTGAHIHGPAPSTNSAPVLQPLNPLGTETSGVLSGSMTLTAPQLQALLNDQVYANIHTTANPGGEIRGQLIPINLKANLNGTNETPGVSTSATGVGTFNVVGNQFYYNLTYTGLSANAVAAHIHGPALPGVPANVLQPLPGVSGTAGVLSGSLTLGQPELGYLVDGLVYVNIHTTANQNGEIRGQITP